MRLGTIREVSTDDFLAGRCRHDITRGEHEYKASLVNGGIVVVDGEGRPVKVTYASTADNRTCYAHVGGVGFIGGWTYPHRKQPFRELVAYINRGVVYADMNDLPKSHKIKRCPHCGEQLR